MQVAIYKPNKSNTGCACSFSYNNEDGTVWLNMIKQFSWDESTRNGSFSQNAKSEEKSIRLKFNEFECGSLIRAIDTWTPAKFFHTFKDNKTQISLTLWDKKDEAGTKAFGLSVTRNSSDTFKLALEYGEAIAVRILLESAIRRRLTFNATKKENPNPQ